MILMDDLRACNAEGDVHGYMMYTVFIGFHLLHGLARLHGPSC